MSGIFYSYKDDPDNATLGYRSSEQSPFILHMLAPLFFQFVLVKDSRNLRHPLLSTQGLQ